jgi:hypothetical protein
MFQDEWLTVIHVDNAIYKFYSKRGCSVRKIFSYVLKVIADQFKEKLATIWRAYAR